MQILTFTTLYPNAAQPSHGVFVENRIRHLAASGEVTPHVIAPVPYFPLTASIFGRYAAMARAPKMERRHGLSIEHPRFPLIPKVGMNMAATLLYYGVRDSVRRAVKEKKIQLIDAHYFYPDGVAAVRLAKELGVPVVITGRGSDLSELTDFPIPRQQIINAALSANALITVCQALKDKLLDLGIPDEKVHVFRNGVDLNLFYPGDRDAIRTDLGVERPLFLSVGHLIPRKGHDLVIRALQKIPDAHLMIAGEGPERATLESLVRDLQLQNRVSFMGSVPHDRLRDFYTAADALVLASSREGWANVLLEAMACGTPVVATDVWGTSEVVHHSVAGRLVKERTPDALAHAMHDMLQSLPARQETRSYAEQFSWDETTQNQLTLFSSLLAN